MGESPCSFPGYVVVDQLVIVKVEVRGLPVRVHRSDGGGVDGVVAVGARPWNERLGARIRLA